MGRHLVELLLSFANHLHLPLLYLFLYIHGFGRVDEDQLLPLHQFRLLALIRLPDAELGTILLVEFVERVLWILLKVYVVVHVLFVAVLLGLFALPLRVDILLLDVPTLKRFVDEFLILISGNKLSIFTLLATLDANAYGSF